MQSLKIAACKLVKRPSRAGVGAAAGAQQEEDPVVSCGRLQYSCQEDWSAVPGGPTGASGKPSSRTQLFSVGEFCAARQLLTHIILKKVTTYRAIKITTYELKFLDVNVDDRRGPLFRGT